MTAEISSAMDGEVRHEDALHLFAAMKSRDEQWEAWRTYHLIGDCLRQTTPLSNDFAVKVGKRLAQEPTILAPMRHRLPTVDHPLIGLSAAASVAIITFAGWTAYQHSDMQPSAMAPVASKTQAEKYAAVSNKPSKSFSPYLVAHHETSPSMGMQGVTPYIRAVADNQ
jgi:Negative regulator of sigma E activity